MNPLTWLTWKQWLLVALAVGVIGFHYWDRHSAVTDALALQSATFESEKAKAILAAKADWDKNTHTIDIMADLDRKNLQDRLAAIDVKLEKVKGGYHEVVIHDPLPAGCFASPGRVRSVNQSLGH